MTFFGLILLQQSLDRSDLERSKNTFYSHRIKIRFPHPGIT